MKKIVQLLFACFLFAHPLLSQEDSCQGNTWIKLLGKVGTYERGLVLCPSGDGNLYVTGSKPDSGLILKINPDGEILWVRSFDFFPGYDNIHSLSLDSDGMLLGCVRSCTCVNNSGLQNTCYFKYDPQQDKLLWVWRPGFYTTYAYLLGIREKYPDGNYLINFASNFPPFENVIMEIDRQTGQEMPGNSWRYEWQNGGSRRFKFSFLQDSLIMIAEEGYYDNGFQRLSLVCISASDGQPKWWQRSHLPSTDSANIIFKDFTMDDDTVVSVSGGNDESKSGQKSFIFLQKTALEDDILWVKKYDLIELPLENPAKIIQVDDGYAVFGGTVLGQGDLFILKTDFDGNALWARRYRYSTGGGSGVGHYYTNGNQFLEMDGFLYFTAYSRDSSGAWDWIIAKLDSEGLVGDSCAYLTPTPVETYPILDPVQEQPPLSFRNLDIDFCSPVPIKGTSAADVSGYRTICENICTPEEGCDIKINGCAKFELLSIASDADGNRHYRVRFTNACAGQTLNYVAIQLPDGTVAVGPNDGAVVSTETGGDYLVRNPNYSPFYSVRFRSQGVSIGAGASEVFEYVLPPQAQPAYINVLARFQSGQSYEAHLNVFNCPVQQAVGNRSDNIPAQISIAPNPATDLLTVTLPEAGAGAGSIEIFSAEGRLIYSAAAQGNIQEIQLSGFTTGVYWCRWTVEGKVFWGKVVVTR